MDIRTAFVLLAVVHVGGTFVHEEELSYCGASRDEVPGSCLWWPQTPTGTVRQQPCPEGATGFVSRACYGASGETWGRADVSLCRNLGLSTWLTSTDHQRQGKARLRSTTDFQQLLSSAADDSVLYPEDLMLSVSVLENMTDLLEASGSEFGAQDVDDLNQFTEAYVETANTMVAPQTHAVWLNLKDPFVVIHTAVKIVELVERFVKLVAGMINHLRKELSHQQDEINFTAPGTTTEDPAVTTFVASSDFLDVEVLTVAVQDGYGEDICVGGNFSGAVTMFPKTVLRQRGGLFKTVTQQVFVYQAVFHSLEPLLTAAFTSDPKDGNGTLVMNSAVVSSTVFGLKEGDLDNLSDPIVITIQHQEILRNSSPGCYFLNTTTSSSENLWSTKGCKMAATNDTHTVCHCYHLTNFAILTDMFDVVDEMASGHKAALSVLSYVGGVLSVICCAASIIIFQFFGLKEELIRCHEMLALSIILSQLTFFGGVEATGNQSVCTTIAIGMHYILTCLFCWMLVEGLHIYISLVKVFEKRRFIRKYVVIGWGVPVLVVAFSALTFSEDYGSQRHCWLKDEALIAGFMPFVGFTIGCNCVVLVLVVKVMMRAATNPARVKCSGQSYCLIRKSLRAVVVLHPLLGLTWIFGFLMIDASSTLVFTYLFTICNSLQGVLFFIFHCVMNNDIREAVNGKWLHHVRTLRRVSSLWSVQTNFSEVFDAKTGLPSCSSISGGTLRIADGTAIPHRLAVPYQDLVPKDVVRRVSLAQLRRLSLAMATINSEIKEAKRTVDLEDVMRCFDLLTNEKSQRPDVHRNEKPPAYEECVEYFPESTPEDGLDTGNRPGSVDTVLPKQEVILLGNQAPVVDNDTKTGTGANEPEERVCSCEDGEYKLCLSLETADSSEA